MVDFLKYLTPEQREKVARDREYIAKEKADYRAKSHYDLVVTALHAYHNSGCTSRVAKWQPQDVVYDAALIFRVLPEMIERIACAMTAGSSDPDSDENHLYDAILAHRRGEVSDIMCPVKGCRSRVELP